MKQSYSFIEDRVIYSKTQSGFCKHHSTNTLLIKIRDYILNALLDRGEVTIAVMTDFSKVSDTVGYFTLIRKLHSLDISTSTLNHIASYLTNRTQSSHKTVTCGVPQG